MVTLLPLALALLLPLELSGGAAHLLPSHMGGGTLKCPSAEIPGYITVVDGKVVRDYRGAGGDTAAVGTLPEREDILSLEVRCLRVRSTERASGWARRSAIIMVSKSGALKVAQDQLTELAEVQLLHAERTGGYATSLTELKFTDTRASLGIELKVSDDGWSASVSFKDPSFACRVAVGGAAVADPELRPGVPVCVSADAVH